MRANLTAVGTLLGAGLALALAGAPPSVGSAPPANSLAADGPPANGPAASTGTVRGIVTQAGGMTPIRGARIFVHGTAISALTDPAGAYLLEDVPVGEQTIVARVLGYAEARRTVAVVGGREATLDFTLDAAGGRVQDLTVASAARAAQIQLPFTIAPTTFEARALAWPADPEFNTESYAHVEENDFRLVSAAPTSTFAIDVDRASYANVRRFIRSGARPPVDAVRIEEMINYFHYERDEGALDETADHPFAVETEVSGAPWAPEHRLVRIGLRAPAVETAHLPPGNLVFLVDVSGSMASPAKLPLLKRSLAVLVEQLRASDRVAIVVYAGAAGLALPSTPGDRGEDILAALDRLEAGGSTAGGTGLALAYEVARRHFIEGGSNRIILATDGDFNVGPSSDGEMVRLIEEARESGVFLTVLGFGTGNLKDSKMERIANHGNGNFHYVDGIREARKVLVEEMGGTLLTVAKDVKLQVEFNPARAATYRLIGYENRLLAREDFNDDAKDAGEIGAGHAVTALYEVVPSGQPVPRASADELRYQPASETRPTSTDGREDELLFVKIRYKAPDGTESRLLARAVEDRPAPPSLGFRFASAVAGFGMLLRESPHAGDLTLGDVLRLAEEGRGADARGHRAEFIRLVETARDLELLDGEMAGPLPR